MVQLAPWLCASPARRPQVQGRWCHLLDRHYWRSSRCWWPPRRCGSPRASSVRHRHGGASYSKSDKRWIHRRRARRCGCHGDDPGSRAISTIEVVMVCSTLMAWQINPGSKPTFTHLAQASHCWLSRSACWFRPSLRRFVYWPRELVGTHRYLPKESGIARGANEYGLKICSVMPLRLTRFQAIGSLRFRFWWCQPRLNKGWLFLFSNSHTEKAF